ncbi:MAG: transporter substrate-binding domain-containing protein [Blautia sp.]|nr:transporter substrate-binding domain-containing protein [Blautia sp.]
MNVFRTDFSRILLYLLLFSLFLHARPVPAESTSAEKAAGLSTGEEEAQTGDLYLENEYNYVDASMDVSNGIPDNAAGRLLRIKETGKLVVATEPYYPPQEFIDPSLSGQEQYVGADMELAKLIAERMDVELMIVPLDFTDVLSGIAAGEYDLAISALSYTPERAASMTLSKGYYYAEGGSRTGLMIRSEDRTRFTDVESLSGRDLIVQRGSIQELLATENISRYRQFRRASTLNDVYLALQTGQVHAAAVDLEAAARYISSNPGCRLALIDNVSFSLEEQFQGDRIAAPKGEGQLIGFVNGVIDEVLADGLYMSWYEDAVARSGELGM